MSRGCRHFNALMKKNFINWKRTPLGSICELLLPILLTLLLVYQRAEIKPVPINDYSLYSLRHPLYMISKPDETTGSYQRDFVDQVLMQRDLLDDMRGFMDYTNYINLNTTVHIEVDLILRVFNLDGIVGEVVDFMQDRLEKYNSLQDFIRTTPLDKLTESIDWIAVNQIIAELRLSKEINVVKIREFVQMVDDYFFKDSDKTVEEWFGIYLPDWIRAVKEIDLDAWRIPVPLFGYLPILDITGPYLFYPQHCYGNSDLAIYDQPVIAYIRTNSTIEKAVVESITSLFNMQAALSELLKMVQTFSFLEQGI